MAPWTIEDVEKYNAGLSAEKKRQWVAVANSVLEKCLEDGGTEKECAAEAIRQANGVVAAHQGEPALQNEISMGIYGVQTGAYQIRNVMHQGREHIVVPVVMMTEGVHAGSHGPLLHPAAELGRFVESWNGIPIVVQHPQRDGQHVSANAPDLIDNAVVGRVYNTCMDGGKLKAEAWIDREKLRQVSLVALGAISQGMPLEVSVGVFTDDEPVEGEWNGESYKGIARNHRPDHLALLPGGKGACSWEDGCGIRINEGKGGEEKVINVNKISYSGTESTPWSAPTLSDFDVEGNRWEDLSQADRAKVANHFLIGSADAETFGDLHFPVVNPRTGKLNEHALRAVIGGRGAALKAVSAKVRDAARKRAYRLLNEEFGAELEIPTTLESSFEYLEVLKSLASNGLAVIQFNQSPGFRETIDKIQAKLNRMDDGVRVHIVCEVYEDDFIYEVCYRSVDGPVSLPLSSVLYRREYKVNKDGSVEFLGEPVVVKREVRYIDVLEKSADRSVGTMSDSKKPCCPEKVRLLLQNVDSPWKEADKEWLESLDEVQISKLVDQANLVSQLMEEAQRPISKEELALAVQEQAKTPEEFAAFAPEEIREEVLFAVKEHAAKRADMVKQIVANSKFTEEELKNKTTVELDKLVSMIPKRADYSGLAGGAGGWRSNSNNVLFPPGIEIYDEKGVKING